MTHKPKVLVGIPTYPGHDYCKDEFIAGAKNLVYDQSEVRKDVLMIWNGPERPTGYPVSWKTEVMQSKLGETGLQLLCRKQNRLREYALENGYDYLYLLESDNIPPSDTIERFIHHDVDIVSALYFVRSMETVQVHIPKDHKRVQEFKRLFPEKDVPDASLLTRVETIPTVWGIHKGKSRLWGVNDALPQRGLVEILAAGVGSVLITREILETIPFRLREGENLDRQFTDFIFYHDTREAGFTTYVDTDCWAEHLHIYDRNDDTLKKWFDAETLEEDTKPVDYGYKADNDYPTHLRNL